MMTNIFVWSNSVRLGSTNIVHCIRFAYLPIIWLHLLFTLSMYRWFDLVLFYESIIFLHMNVLLIVSFTNKNVFWLRVSLNIVHSWNRHFLGISLILSFSEKILPNRSLFISKIIFKEYFGPKFVAAWDLSKNELSRSSSKMTVI